MWVRQFSLTITESLCLRAISYGEPSVELAECFFQRRQPSSRRELRILRPLHGKVDLSVLRAQLPRTFHHSGRPIGKVRKVCSRLRQAPSAGGEQSSPNGYASRADGIDQAVAKHVGGENNIHCRRHHPKADAVPLLSA